MSLINLNNVTYTYPEDSSPVVENLTLSLPAGVVSFIGQNGTGKTTVMLLAGARLFPQSGNVTIDGRDSREFTDENDRNRLISFVYQNMEFETEKPVGDLFRRVYADGSITDKNDGFIDFLVKEFGLENSVHKKLQKMSKGDIQKSVILFSLLYGSRIVMMDEPVFALEYPVKKRILGFLREYAVNNGITIYYSLHELELSQRYSDLVLLFHKNGKVELMGTREGFAREKLEEVFEIPYGLLHKKEELYRERLVLISEKLRTMER